MFANGQCMLITTSDYFQGPDGTRYLAVWGRATYHELEKELGFDPKIGTNLFLIVGQGEGAICIAGDKVRYAIVCKERPIITGGVYVPPSEAGA